MGLSVSKLAGGAAIGVVLFASAPAPAQSITDKLGNWLFGPSSAPADASNPANTVAEVDCPGVTVRQGASTLSITAPGAVLEVPVEKGVPDGKMALDIGSESRRRFAQVIDGARTVFWNGPMGVFETPPFDAGTRAIAAAVGAVEAYTVIGGGETVAAVKQAGAEGGISHVSTGGGASLELIEGKELPGVKALS